MKKSSKVLLSLLSFSLLSNVALASELNYKFSQNGYVGFYIKKLGIKVINASFTKMESSAQIDSIVGLKNIQFKIDVGSVDAGNNAMNQKLLSDKLFNVKKYPTILFTSTSIQKVDDQQYQILGKLTIKGKERDAIFASKIQYSGDSKTYFLDAITQIEPQSFEMKSMLSSFTDHINIYVQGNLIQ